MNATDLATLSIKELRAFCSSHSIEVTEDRRYRISYINAIGLSAEESTFTIGLPRPESTYTIGLPTSAIGLVTPDPLKSGAVMAERSTTVLDIDMESDGSSPTAPIAESIVQPPAPQPTPQQPATQHQPKTQYRGASIVMIIPLILLTVAIILLKIGISTLIPLIGSSTRFMVSIWQSVTDTDRGIESIDYSQVAA